MRVEKNPLRKKVIKDSIWNLASTLTARIGGLIFTIMAARMLLPEGFGLYNLALSVAMIFITFADMGINQTLIRYISEEINKNIKKATAYFYYLLKIKIIVSLISSFLLLVSAHILSNYVFHKPELTMLFIILSLYILILAIEGFYESTFFIPNKVSYAAVKEFVFQLGRIITLVAVFYLLAKQYYVLGAILGLVITMLSVLIIVYFLSRKLFQFPKNPDYLLIDKKRVLKFILFLTISNLSAMFFSYMDILMLGIFISSEYIGYYKAAIGLVFAISGTLSFSWILLSILTKIKNKKLSGAFDKIVKYSMILVIPTIVGLIMLSRYLVVLIYGHEYIKGSTCLYILSPMIFFVIVVSLFLSLLSSREKTKEFAILTLMCTLFNILLNYVFIIYFRRFSEFAVINAVATSTLLSWVLYFLGVLSLSKKLLGIGFHIQQILKPLFASLVMAIFLFVFNKSVGDMTPIKGFFEVVIGAAIYFIILILIRGIMGEDLKLVYKNIFYFFRI